MLQSNPLRLAVDCGIASAQLGNRRVILLNSFMLTTISVAPKDELSASTWSIVAGDRSK